MIISRLFPSLCHDSPTLRLDGFWVPLVDIASLYVCETLSDLCAKIFQVILFERFVEGAVVDVQLHSFDGGEEYQTEGGAARHFGLPFLLGRVGG